MINMEPERSDLNSCNFCRKEKEVRLMAREDIIEKVGKGKNIKYKPCRNMPERINHRREPE